MYPISWVHYTIAKQAEGRAHRIGQQRTVFVHDLYTVDTIEQRIHQLLQEKQALFDNAIDDLSADYVQGKFTDEDLFGLFDITVPVSSQPNRRESSAQGTPLQNSKPRTVLDKLCDAVPARQGQRESLTPVVASQNGASRAEPVEPESAGLMLSVKSLPKLSELSRLSPLELNNSLQPCTDAWGIGLN